MGRSITLMYEEAKTHQQKRRWERILGIGALIFIVLLCLSVGFGIYKDVVIYKEQKAMNAEINRMIDEMQLKVETLKEED